MIGSILHPPLATGLASPSLSSLPTAPRPNVVRVDEVMVRGEGDTAGLVSLESSLSAGREHSLFVFTDGTHAIVPGDKRQTPSVYHCPKRGGGRV